MLYEHTMFVLGNKQLLKIVIITPFMRNCPNRR